MARVIAVLHPVAVLEADGAYGVNQHRTEGMVAVVERLTSQLDAAAQMAAVRLIQYLGLSCGAVEIVIRSHRVHAANLTARPGTPSVGGGRASWWWDALAAGAAVDGGFGFAVEVEGSVNSAYRGIEQFGVGDD